VPYRNISCNDLFFYGLPFSESSVVIQRIVDLLNHNAGVPCTAHVPQKDRIGSVGMGWYGLVGAGSRCKVLQPFLPKLWNLFLPLLFSHESLFVVLSPRSQPRGWMGNGRKGSLATDSCKFGQLSAAGCSRGLLVCDHLWLILFIGCFGFGLSRKIPAEWAATHGFHQGCQEFYKNIYYRVWHLLEIATLQ